MENNIKEKELKKPISHEKIYQIMLRVGLVASSIFFLLNLIKLNIPGIIAIGLCIASFIGILVYMKKKYIPDTTKEFIVSMSLIVLVLLISLFSGASYADDFSFHLAILGITGTYFRPEFTKKQIVASNIAFVIMYIVHPEKGGGLSQYLLGVAAFNLAAVLFYIAIKRGKVFIDIAQFQTSEAQNLLLTMRKMGYVLEQDFESSSHTIKVSTKELKDGSDVITSEAGNVSASCNDLQERIRITGTQILDLNQQVKVFEEALADNHDNMEAMKQQIASVSTIILKSDEVFQNMKQQMNEVASIAHKIGEISFRTTILSLNASVEAAHAGNVGTGFALVANEMKELSENSDEFAVQVSKVVKSLLKQVEKTSSQFVDSINAIDATGARMGELQESFLRLTEQFDTLYENIDQQNQSIKQVDTIFNDLQHKIIEMRDNSVENQVAVNNIAKTMDDYRTSISKVIENTKV